MPKDDDRCLISVSFIKLWLLIQILAFSHIQSFKNNYRTSLFAEQAVTCISTPYYYRIFQINLYFLQITINFLLRGSLTFIKLSMGSTSFVASRPVKNLCAQTMCILKLCIYWMFICFECLFVLMTMLVNRLLFYHFLSFTWSCFPKNNCLYLFCCNT